MKEFKKILLSLMIALIFFVISKLFFNTHHSIILAIISFLVTLWTNEGLPLGVVSLLPILLFPSFEILSTNDVTTNYSKSIIFLFLGGFLSTQAVKPLALAIGI